MNVLDKYTATQVSSLGQVELESRALINTASKLNLIKENWDVEKDSLNEALEKNRRLWTILATSMVEEDCPQPAEIKSNITNLAMFVFKKTMAIMVEPKPESLDILISINMNIAKGLSDKQEEVAEVKE